MDYRDWGRGDLARHERRSTESWDDAGRDPILGTAYPRPGDDLRPIGRYRHDAADPGTRERDGYADIDDDGLVPSGPYAPATAPTYRTPSRRRGADRDDADRYIPDWATGADRGRSPLSSGDPGVSVPSARTPLDESADRDRVGRGREASGQAAIAEPTAEIGTVRRGRHHREPDQTSRDGARASRFALPGGSGTDMASGRFPEAGPGSRDRAAGGRRRRRVDDEDATSFPPRVGETRAGGSEGTDQVAGRAATAGPVDPSAPSRRGRRRAADDDGDAARGGRSGRFIDSKSWDTSGEPLADSAEIAQWIRSPDPDRKRGGPEDIDRWWDRTADPEEWARPARERLARERLTRTRSDRTRSDRDRSDRDRPDRDRPDPPGSASRSRRGGRSRRDPGTDTGTGLDGRGTGTIFDDRDRDLGRDLELDRDLDLGGGRGGTGRRRAPEPRRWENDTGLIFRDTEPEPEPVRWRSDDTGFGHQAGPGRRDAQADTGTTNRDRGTTYRGSATAYPGRDTGYGSNLGSGFGSGLGSSSGSEPGNGDGGAGTGWRGRDVVGSAAGSRSGGAGQWAGTSADTSAWDRYTDTGQWDRFTDTTEWDRSELTQLDPEALEDRYWPDREEMFWSGTRLAGDDPRWMDTPASAPRSPAVAYPLPDRDREDPAVSAPSRWTDRDDRATRYGAPARTGTAARPGTTSSSTPGSGTSRAGTARSATAVRTGTATWSGRPARSSRRRLEDDLLDPNPGGPFRAVLYAAAWYAVPVLVFLVWLLTLDNSVPPGCVTDVTGGGCDSERARAMQVVFEAAPRFGTALASSLVCAVVFRWWGSTWRTGSVGLAAAVAGGGISTVLLSVISGQPIGG